MTSKVCIWGNTYICKLVVIIYHCALAFFNKDLTDKIWLHQFFQLCQFTVKQKNIIVSPPLHNKYIFFCVNWWKQMFFPHLKLSCCSAVQMTGCHLLSTLIRLVPGNHTSKETPWRVSVFGALLCVTKTSQPDKSSKWKTTLQQLRSIGGICERLQKTAKNNYHLFTLQQRHDLSKGS